MNSISPISVYLMSALYVLAGIAHFIYPKFFLKIMPKWVPFPRIVNFIVGGAEMVLGLALILTSMRTYAAIGIIVLLIAVFPANVYHFQLALKKKKNIAITLFRLPIQGFLIYWAYTMI